MNRSLEPFILSIHLGGLYWSPSLEPFILEPFIQALNSWALNFGFFIQARSVISATQFIFFITFIYNFQEIESIDPDTTSGHQSLPDNGEEAVSSTADFETQAAYQEVDQGAQGSKQDILHPV